MNRQKNILRYFKTSKGKEALRKAVGKYAKTAKGIFQSYRNNAQRRKLTFQLTSKQFINWFNRTDCFYCLEHISTIGLDRKNNSKGYSEENIVFCCNRCNKIKSNLLTFDEMRVAMFAIKNLNIN